MKGLSRREWSTSTSKSTIPIKLKADYRARISFSCGRISGFFALTTSGALVFIFNATFETKKRGIMQRVLLHLRTALLGVALSAVRSTTVDDILIKRAFTNFLFLGKGKILRVRDQPRCTSENRIGEETRNLRSTLSAWNGLAEKSNSGVLEIKGATKGNA